MYYGRLLAFNGCALVHTQTPINVYYRGEGWDRGGRGGGTGNDRERTLCLGWTTQPRYSDSRVRKLLRYTYHIGYLPRLLFLRLFLWTSSAGKRPGWGVLSDGTPTSKRHQACREGNPSVARYTDQAAADGRQETWDDTPPREEGLRGGIERGRTEGISRT